MSNDDWRRRYPPLGGAVVAILLAVLVLPSALNVPQSAPTQTLEFAPVPPASDEPPPPDRGNVGRLGTGSSSTVRGDAVGGPGPGLPPPPDIPGGVGDRPVTKRCVGSPPRQTEDPMSPPCVAFFDGDNGGATYRGVTREEVRILFYLDGGTICEGNTSRGMECRPADTYVDLAQPPTDDEPVFVRELRNFQQHFNGRYQTYGRFVHFFVYFTPGGGQSIEDRRAQAAANITHVDPFAVIAYPQGNSDAYVEAAAAHGVLSFGATEPRSAAFFRRHPGMIWGYLPSVDEQARVYADFACTQVVPYPVSASGNGDQGSPRRLGLLRSADQRLPAMIHFADVARREIEACGGTFVTERTFPVADRQHGNNTATGESNSTVAGANIADFVANGVTTVIWPQGFETDHSKAARTAEYYPEWVVAGDGRFDGYINAQFEDQDVWHEHAFVVTPVPLVGDPVDTPCYAALTEGNPDDADREMFCTNWSFYYDDLRQLFTGIQVAGPRLSVETLDRGFHAIPHIESPDPSVPACFYGPGDYTCVKDAAAMWWDRAATAPGASTPGCWRVLEDGLRHVAGAWPQHDLAAPRSPDDPCNGYASRTNFTLS